jgi:chromosome segregation ATPase
MDSRQEMAELFSRIRDLTVGLDSKKRELGEIESSIQENDSEIEEIKIELLKIKSEDIISFSRYQEAYKDLEVCKKKQKILSQKRSVTNREVSLKLKEIQGLKEKYEEVSQSLGIIKARVLEFRRDPDVTPNPDVGI